MFCSNCGAQINDGAKFCTSCGATIQTNNTPPGSMPVQQMPVQTPSQMPGQAPYQYQYPPTYPYPEKKQSKAPLIIGFSILAVLLIAIIVLLCVKLFSSDSGSSNTSDRSDRREESNSDREDRNSSEEEKENNGSGGTVQKGASSATDALNNLFNAINSGDRNAALAALHPIYGTLLQYADDDYIYEFFCGFATSDMYLSLADALRLAYADPDLQLYFYDYEIMEQEPIIANSIDEVNEILEYIYDELNSQYGAGTPNSNTWQIDSAVNLEFSFNGSAYGEDMKEYGEAGMAEINGSWYVLFLDF